MNNAEISLCMIVRDEEEVLERCLSSIADLMDEIIIVDTGSKDKTKEIANKFTDKIYDFEWVDDFSKARNFSFSKATKDYIMWLDADDVVPEESRKQILKLKDKLIPHKMECVMMEYEYSYDQEGNPTFSHRRERIVKRECGFKWVGLVHEILDVTGVVFVTNVKIKHLRDKPNTSRNIKIYEKAIEQGKTLVARDMLHYANECFDHKKHEKAIEWYHRFLKDTNAENIDEQIYANLKLVDCYIHFQQYDQAMKYCLETFRLDTPRAEICCRFGYIYEFKKEIPKAISWYKIATIIDVPGESMYVQQPCYTWLPHIQLCSCFISLGRYDEAKVHNDNAAKYIPNSSYVKNNEKLLEELKSKIQESST
ncbi:tetratricopeptide repeat-containing glycosyltransferase family 2 protein [Chengkuizengella axinellae]|uniref:Glycosyltransferase n=1 Tax=Chengkuizengella axinellae TaxID=3064388 RepID=A0ABT9J1Y0_9BACL|nr:glycosyltransferase [Chengkuizengella sp. 2205SS18-9]MDP5275503.1 glycosyltransferase [Chengkuizengella sp. 2205SS18-9]